MKTKTEFHHAYSDGHILSTKIDIHARYSSIPIDLPAKIAQKCKIPGEQDILDIGCGTGYLLEYFFEKGHRGNLVGIDLVRPPIPDAPGKHYLAADAEKIPLPAETFDIAMCVHAVSHLSDIAVAMREAHRVLRPAGQYLATANSLNSYPRTAEYRRRIHDLFDWGPPEFTTTHVNAENLAQTLEPYWDVQSVDIFDGELRIPVREYPNYFAANIPTWDHTPTKTETVEILHLVAEWASRDHENGFIVEPKRVSVATCRKQTPETSFTSGKRSS